LPVNGVRIGRKNCQNNFAVRYVYGEGFSAETFTDARGAAKNDASATTIPQRFPGDERLSSDDP
jgi:hypothetical protein